jgi:uncharacterized protein YbjT (DUF2867 family)
MNTSTDTPSRQSQANQGHALLAGSTGLIGRALAQHWASTHSAASRLHLLLRKAGPNTETRCISHVVDFAALPALPAADEAYCCLGTTIAVAGSQEAFRAVDLGAVLAFAQAARQAGVQRFAVVSALGASASSRTFYNRVKGEMESALQALGFAQLVIARPSLLAGDRASLGQPTRWAERATLAVTGPLAALIPLAWRPIEAAVVARAMVRALAADRPGVQILESADLQKLGA